MLTSNPAIQFTVYETIKRYIRGAGKDVSFDFFYNILTNRLIRVKNAVCCARYYSCRRFLNSLLFLYTLSTCWFVFKFYLLNLMKLEKFFSCGMQLPKYQISPPPSPPHKLFNTVRSILTHPSFNKGTKFKVFLRNFSTFYITCDGRTTRPPLKSRTVFVLCHFISSHPL